MTETQQAPLNTVTWWEIPVTDITAGQAFYRSVFGWEFTAFGDEQDYLGILNEGELIGGLYRAEGAATTGPTVKIYVNVADLEASLAAADAHGGAVLTPRTEVGGDMGWWAEISDPDGRWLGLCTGEPATTAG